MTSDDPPSAIDAEVTRRRRSGERFGDTVLAALFAAGYDPVTSTTEFHEFVDLDAVNALFHAAAANASTVLGFSTPTHHVTVSGDGLVRVRALGDSLRD